LVLLLLLPRRTRRTEIDSGGEIFFAALPGPGKTIDTGAGGAG